MRRLRASIPALGVLLWLTPAQAVPTIWGVWTWTPAEPVHLLVLPHGGGPDFTATVSQSGAVVDATIRVQLWADGNDDPTLPPDPQVVANFPREDIWLEAAGVAACLGGATADADTDPDGWFSFSNPPLMGGANDPDLAATHPRVIVNGAPLSDEFGLPIRPAIVINSPDLNADLAVDLTDVAAFAGDFYGGSHPFRSDLVWDGVVNLADIVRMAQGMGSRCGTP